MEKTKNVVQITALTKEFAALCNLYVEIETFKRRQAIYCQASDSKIKKSIWKEMHEIWRKGLPHSKMASMGIEKPETETIKAEVYNGNLFFRGSFGKLKSFKEILKKDAVD